MKEVEKKVEKKVKNKVKRIGITKYLSKVLCSHDYKYHKEMETKEVYFLCSRCGKKEDILK